MASSSLTSNDASVLSALFDPESSLSSTIRIENALPSAVDAQKISSIQILEREALQPVNQEQPAVSDIHSSISRLTSIIEAHPKYPSAWNNRAQARRMLFKDEDLPSNPDIVAEIADDLAQAIELATPIQATGAVLQSTARVLASAHTHRGYLLLLASKSDANRKMLDSIPGLRHLQKEDLEETASRELRIGGRYGNETARQLAVKTNPYAKLCGSIVREALMKEVSDYQMQVKKAE